MTDDPFADLPKAPVEEEAPKKKAKKPKGRSFFDCVSIIYKSKDKAQMECDIASHDFKSIYSAYMVQRYLSFHEPYLKLIQDNQIFLERMSPEEHYRFLFRLIPANKYLWIKYCAKKKKK